MNRPSYLLFKQCSKCREILHVSKFYKHKRGKYGVRPDCKECHYKEHREERLDYQKDYYKEHKEERLDYAKKYREEHKEEICEYKKKWYEENKDDVLEYCKEYHKENKDKVRKYKSRNKEKISKYNKKWRKENPNKIFNYRIKRKNKKINQGRGITKEQWQEMMLFFDFKCAYSGEYIGGNSDKRTIDHIVALNNGGEHEIWNLVPMYSNYNYSKQDNNILDWYLQQEYFDIDRLTKIYEWRIYAYWKWK